MQLKIELTSHCNAACVFCGEMENKGYIDPDLAKSIVDEFPEVKKVSASWFGESTMHPQFYEILEYWKSKGKQIGFYTNGSMIDAQRLAAINPAEVHFSVEADNKELYERIRVGLDWDIVYQNIIDFQAAKKNTRTAVRMVVCEENRKRINEIIAFWKGKVDSVNAYNEHSNFRDAGGHYLSVKGCTKPDDFMIVAWNGDYVICCIDYFRTIVLGNVRDGARKVWDEGAAARKAIRNGQMLDICKRCGFTHSGYKNRVR